MNKKPKYAKPYPIRIEESLYLKIQAIAKNESRSMNKQIELCLKNMVNSYEATNGEIIIDIDALDE